MDLQKARASTHLPLAADLSVAVLLLTLAVLAAGALFQLSSGFYPLAALLGISTLACISARWPGNRDFGWANRVTLARGLLVITLVSMAPFLDASLPAERLWLYAGLCLIALVLDGADGYVARATGTETDFGARFDMELDALFILGLCLAVSALDRAGIWVLALGLMRYVFLATGQVWPFLGGALPDSFRRKTVCVWQLVTLMVALLPVTPDALAFWSLVFALALLCYSFGIDIRWLYRNHAQQGEDNGPLH